MSLLCHGLIELRLLASAVQCHPVGCPLHITTDIERTTDLTPSIPHFTQSFVGCDPNPISLCGLDTEEIHLSTLTELFVVGEYVL